ncbi:unnamed protein product, partial [Iphiclides podalirius]
MIFDKVNSTIPAVVDEVYHLPQGLSYCKRNFTYWDKKITTLPGLYLVSLHISPFFECNTYNLRFVNLVASCVNFLLFSSMLLFIYGNYSESPVKIVLQALSLTILPPLYFFSHIYYTDTLSMTFLLAFTRLCFTNKTRILMFIFGVASMLMRQTNVAWIAMVVGHKALDVFIRSSRVFGNRYLSRTSLSRTSVIAKDIDVSKLKRYYGISDAIISLKYHLSTSFLTYIRFITWQDWSELATHTLLLGSFIAFVVVNGGIVVGDKKAHEATIHLPQLLYFLLFYGVFGLPYALAKFASTLRLILANKTRALAFALLFAGVVHFNTVVHPYLLADNRHYTFYIWNRWFGRYSYAPFAIIPVYVFLLFSLYDNLKDQNCVSFLLPYCLSTFLVLALQKMIEVRYFLVPYVILRLRFYRPSYSIVLAEFVWYLVLNALTFYVFFTKEVYWKDYDYAQRIIW